MWREDAAYVDVIMAELMVANQRQHSWLRKFSLEFSLSHLFPLHYTKRLNVMVFLWSAGYQSVEHAASKKLSLWRMSKPLQPSLMTLAERLDEIAEILAAGLHRLRRKENSSSSNDLRDYRLDFSPDRSVHATPRKRRKVAR